MLKVINIKDSHPNVDYALFLLEQEIHDAKTTNTQVLVVVHGYGSHGKGGAIKKGAVQRLKQLQKQGTIRTFVCGEHWGDSNPDKMLINKLCPESILCKDIGNLNSGVTVVLVY